MNHTVSGRFDQISSQAEALAQERFAFLVQERGFTQGLIKRSTYATSIYYVRTPELGLEVRLDFADAYIEVYLVQLHSGKPPRQLGTKIDGKRIRMQVPHFLHRVLVVQDPWLEDVLRVWKSPSLPSSETDGYRFADVILTDLSNMVARYLDLILEQPMEVLFPAARDSRANSG